MKFKEKPNCLAKEIINETKDFRFGIKKWKAYRVKYTIYKLLHGSLKDYYNNLGRYIKELKISNSGSTYIPETNVQLQKKSMFFKGFLYALVD